MSYTRAYTVPDYYESFACKGPDCQNTCCRGWGISLSLMEYYRLSGMPCSKKLRQKLDRAFHLAERPTNERYALINPTYDGDCPLHRSDGYCSVQKECGESVLASVCRYYPRSVRSGFFDECACSNSCEAVLELLFRREAKLGFHKTALTLDFIEPEAAETPAPPAYRSVRRLCVDLLQDRSLTLPVRLFRIGEALRALPNLRDDLAIEHFAAGFAKSAKDSLPAPQDLPYSLSIQRFLVNSFDELSFSLRNYGDHALAFFGEGDVSRYADAAARLDAAMPDWPRFFEQVLVNHIFFTAFPFSDLLIAPTNAYASLCAIYALLRFLALSETAQTGDIHRLIDVFSAAFRLIDHSDFDKNAPLLLREAGCVQAFDLCRLLNA